MKKIIVCTLFALVATGAFAQEKGKTRFGFDAGNYFGINLLYNIQDNMNVGVRTGGAIVGKKTQAENVAFGAGITNISAISNYYFGFGNRSAAFVGGGVGRYKLGYGFIGCPCASKQRVQEYKGYKFGGFLTTGLESRKFRLALEYNFLPTSSVVVYDHTDNSLTNDKVKNSYFAVSIGFFIGGGKR